MPYEKQPIIRMFLRTPGLQQQINKPEKDLRSQVHCYQDPTSQKLWWLRNSGHAEDRQVISVDSAFDTTGIITLLLSARTSRKK